MTDYVPIENATGATQNVATDTVEEGGVTKEVQVVKLPDEQQAARPYPPSL
jgi:hypothetical protein